MSIKRVMDNVRANKSTWVKLCLLVLFAVLFHYNQLTFIAEWLSSASLHLKNQAYLDSARMLATTDLTYMGELAAATELARSAEVGVSFFASFNVEVGNLLHTLAKLFEQSIIVLLVSLSAIEILTLLESSAHWLSPFFFEVSIAIVIGYYLAKLFGLSKILLNKIKKISELSIWLFLMAHLALPYSIHLSAVIGQALSDSKRQAMAQSLKNAHDEMVPKSERQDLKAHAESSLSSLKKIHQKHLNHKISHFSRHLFNRIALNIFDLLLVPAILLMVFYRLFKALMAYEVEKSRLE